MMERGKEGKKMIGVRRPKITREPNARTDDVGPSQALRGSPVLVQGCSWRDHGGSGSMKEDRNCRLLLLISAAFALPAPLFWRNSGTVGEVPVLLAGLVVSVCHYIALLDGHLGQIGRQTCPFFLFNSLMNFMIQDIPFSYVLLTVLDKRCLFYFSVCFAFLFCFGDDNRNTWERLLFCVNCHLLFLNFKSVRLYLLTPSVAVFRIRPCEAIKSCLPQWSHCRAGDICHRSFVAVLKLVYSPLDTFCHVSSTSLEYFVSF